MGEHSTVEVAEEHKLEYYSGTYRKNREHSNLNAPWRVQKYITLKIRLSAHFGEFLKCLKSVLQRLEHFI